MFINEIINYVEWNGILEFAFFRQRQGKCLNRLLKEKVSDVILLVLVKQKICTKVNFRQYKTCLTPISTPSVESLDRAEDRIRVNVYY